MTTVVDLKAVKRQHEKKHYAALVMKAWDDADHADRRAFLDRKGEVEIKAREKL